MYLRARRGRRRPKATSVCHLYTLFLADDDYEVDAVPLIGDFGRADSMVESLECRCWPGFKSSNAAAAQPPPFADVFSSMSAPRSPALARTPPRIFRPTSITARRFHRTPREFASR